jgi:maltose O-acetyltransferase
MYNIVKPTKLQLKIAKAVGYIIDKVNRIDSSLKYMKISHRLKHIGENVIFDENIYINKPENLSVGDETYIGQGVFLNAYAPITIGRYCGIAAGCYFITWNHDVNNKEVKLRETGKIASEITIGDGVWVGYGAKVMPGVEIGNGAVVAAGAVVTKNVKSWTVVAGIPAKEIMKRTESGLVKNINKT